MRARKARQTENGPDKIGRGKKKRPRQARPKRQKAKVQGPLAQAVSRYSQTWDFLVLATLIRLRLSVLALIVFESPEEGKGHTVVTWSGSRSVFIQAFVCRPARAARPFHFLLCCCV